MINVEDTITTLLLGRAGENNVRQIEFDYTPWYEEFGEGDIGLLHKRNGDAEPYPITVTLHDDHTCTWDVTNVDTAKKGFGRLQVVYLIDEQVKKSRVYKTHTLESVQETSYKPPDPYESWVEEILAGLIEFNQGKTEVETIISEGRTDLNGIVDQGSTDLSGIIDQGEGDLNQIINDGKDELNNIINSVDITDPDNDGAIIINL